VVIKLGIIGACGRMGKAIARLALESSQFELKALIDANEDFVGKSYQSITGLTDGSIIIEKSVEVVSVELDVLIDFSFYKATLTSLAQAENKGIAYVIGTTGFDDESILKIKNYAEKIPVLLSPNMSLGVNVMLKALKLLTELLSDKYDIEVIEAHHNQKVDSPSGTALKLYEVIKGVIEAKGENYKLVHGREGIVGKRPEKEIGMHAIRAGSIVGEHSVLFAGLDEDITLTHRAQSRDTFAKGALQCAAFLSDKPVGFYNMDSVLGL